MKGCEKLSRSINRIDAFKLSRWRLLRVPWTIRRSNQSVLQEISPEYSLKGLMLKLQYFGYLMQKVTHWKTSWCWERLRAGGEGDDRGQDGWMASLTQWTWVWANSRRWWRTGKPGVLQSMGSQSWTRLATEQQQLVLTTTTKKSIQAYTKEYLIWGFFKILK